MSKYLCNASCSKKVTYIIQILIMALLIVLGTRVYIDSKSHYVEATSQLEAGNNVSKEFDLPPSVAINQIIMY